MIKEYPKIVMMKWPQKHLVEFAFDLQVKRHHDIIKMENLERENRKLRHTIEDLLTKIN